MMLIVVDWEGGSLRRVSLKEWWHFIATPPSRLAVPAPEYHWQTQCPKCVKCFAGVYFWRRYFGFDFILYRRKGRRKWRWGGPLAHGAEIVGYGRIP